MALEKMQGQDGKLEAISYIPQGTDRIKALELGITRFVSVAVTEMYSTIDALKGSNATWSSTQDYTFQTIRNRLGVQGKYRDLFVLCPAILVLIILGAWFSIGIVRAGGGKLTGFNPLDPGSAVVAGMNRDSMRLPKEIVGYSEVDPNALLESNVLVRYGDVNAGRKGIEIIGGTPIQDDVAESIGGRPLSGYKDESPLTPAFPSPQSSK